MTEKMEGEKKETKGARGRGGVEGWGGRAVWVMAVGVIGKVSPLVSGRNGSLASGAHSSAP